jgi:hypothetical protein
MPFRACAVSPLALLSAFDFRNNRISVRRGRWFLRHTTAVEAEDAIGRGQRHLRFQADLYLRSSLGCLGRSSESRLNTFSKIWRVASCDVRRSYRYCTSSSGGVTPCNQTINVIISLILASSSFPFTLDAGSLSTVLGGISPCGSQPLTPSEASVVSWP